MRISHTLPSAVTRRRVTVAMMVWTAGLAVLLACLLFPVSQVTGPRALPVVAGAVVAFLAQLASAAMVLRVRGRAARLVVGLVAQEAAWSFTFVLFLLVDGDPPGNIAREVLPVAMAAALLAVPLAGAHWALARDETSMAPPALDAAPRALLRQSSSVAAAGALVGFLILVAHLRDGTGLASTLVPWAVAAVLLPSCVSLGASRLMRAHQRAESSTPPAPPATSPPPPAASPR
ncbi:MAG TPA: hypothetical protein VIF09_28425 [Polyangiaceae bacterium]